MDYFETIARWQELKEAIRHLQNEERALREGLFSGTFPDPKEGTNKVDLPDGRVFKATHKINRKVLEDQYPSLQLPPKLMKLLFKTKHDLVVSEYRKLDDTTRKAVDKILDIKPGLPTLEVVEAKPEATTVTP